MRLFTCRVCGQTLHFDNRLCVRCGASLGFLAGDATLYALIPAGDGL